MREADLAGPRNRAAADKAGVGDRVMRERNGRVVISARPSSRPITECTLVVSIASSKVIAGRIDGSRFASIVLPEPGGPIIRTL